MHIKDHLRRIIRGYYFKYPIELLHSRHQLNKNRQNYKSGNNPKVSIIIPTYNRSIQLTEKAIPSVLNQVYKNIELIVIGDNCTDDTEDRVSKFSDPRLIFHNLSERGKYPEEPYKRWLVAGTYPANKGLDISTGSWIARLDDDDEMDPYHIEKLLNFAIEGNYEFVYGKVSMEVRKGEWETIGAPELQQEKICHNSILYSSKLRFIKYDPHCWKINEPDDWNLIRRIKESGARIGFLDEIVGTHYLERIQEF